MVSVPANIQPNPNTVTPDTVPPSLGTHEVFEQKCQIMQYFDLLLPWTYWHKLWWTKSGITLKFYCNPSISNFYAFMGLCLLQSKDVQEILIACGQLGPVRWHSKLTPFKCKTSAYNK